VSLYYGTSIVLARACFSAFARWKVEGKEAIPPRGPLIVVANHLSNADPPVVMASFNRRLNTLAKRGLFANPVFSLMLRDMGAYPVEREGKDVAALRWALRLLNQDKAVLLFPEGTRSKKATLQRATPGIGYLALRSQAPVLPVAVTGTENIPGTWRMAIPLCAINVKIGQPFSLPVIEGKLSRTVLQQATDLIMGRIASLLPPKYQGYYASAAASTK
jgi:1-acyl-sn-glycerol-3-phosphate acyltransferase